MPQYQVRVYNRSGVLQHATDQFRVFTIEHMINNVSNLTLGFADDDADPLTMLLDENESNLDNIVELRRAAPEYGIDWYTEYVGFHRTAQRQLTTTDQAIITSYSVGLLDLIRRRSIRHYADTLGSAKGPLPADDVIKIYVDENAGPFATLGGGPFPGRVTAGVTPGLTVAPSANAAASYEGAHAWRNLLDAIQDIGQSNSVDFDVVRTGPAAFEFRTYYPRRGTDRTLGTANPVVFHIGFGNMTNISRTRSRTEEATSVLVLGPGEGPLRDTTLRTSVYIADSPWNLVEIDHNASNEDRLLALQKAGDSVLYEKRPAVAYTFEVIQTPQFAYQKNYLIGDLVTTRFKHFTDDLKIRAVRLNASENAETLAITLETVT